MVKGSFLHILRNANHMSLISACNRYYKWYSICLSLQSSLDFFFSQKHFHWLTPFPHDHSISYFKTEWIEQHGWVLNRANRLSTKQETHFCLFLLLIILLNVHYKHRPHIFSLQHSEGNYIPFLRFKTLLKHHVSRGLFQTYTKFQMKLFIIQLFQAVFYANLPSLWLSLDQCPYGLKQILSLPP